MAYSYITWTALRSQLAARLRDSGKVFFTDAELKTALGEALRVWNCLTGYWRERTVFQTSAGVPFYDLPSLAKDGNGNFARPYTVTDTQVIAEMCAHLLEPSPSGSPLAWQGTEMFSLDDLVKALERRRNQFLMDTGCVVTHFTQNVPAPPVGRVQLPDTTILIRRAAWVDASGKYSNLYAEDEFAASGFQNSWTINPTKPKTYSVSAVSPLQLQLIPIPLDKGALDLLAVEAPPVLNPSTGILLGIPDDLVWAVKWGAMADLLNRDSESKDATRAMYCETRYEQGVQLAQMAQTALRVQVNDVPVAMGSVAELDAFSASWQSGVGMESLRGKPWFAAMAGMNLLAFSKVPDQTYGVSVDLVSNAPIPVNDADLVQIGREQLDAILDMAQHVITFKCGGMEFAETKQMMQNLLRLAGVDVAQLKALSLYSDVMAQAAQEENRMRPQQRGE